VISFTVPAIPVPQPRQRHRIVAGGVRTFAMNYTPRGDPVNDYKATVRLAASTAYQGPPVEGPLEVVFEFVMPRSQSLRWKTRPMPRLWHATGKDLDNLAKSTLDALIGLLFADDGQVARLVLSKMIAGGDESPHVRVTLDRLAEV
jgi:Holliday junction resolvase RusA-like endonuclease